MALRPRLQRVRWADHSRRGTQRHTTPHHTTPLDRRTPPHCITAFLTIPSPHLIPPTRRQWRVLQLPDLIIYTCYAFSPSTCILTVHMYSKHHVYLPCTCTVHVLKAPCILTVYMFLKHYHACLLNILTMHTTLAVPRIYYPRFSKHCTTLTVQYLTCSLH